MALRTLAEKVGLPCDPSALREALEGDLGDLWGGGAEAMAMPFGTSMGVW